MIHSVRSSGRERNITSRYCFFTITGYALASKRSPATRCAVTDVRFLHYERICRSGDITGSSTCRSGINRSRDRDSLRNYEMSRWESTLGAEVGNRKRAVVAGNAARGVKGEAR